MAPIVSLAVLLYAAIVKHIVMFEFQRNTSDEDLQEIKDALFKLPRQVPGVLSYEMGQDLKLQKNNKQLAWAATFRNAEAFAKYQAHPAHTDVVLNVIRFNTKS